MKIAYVTPDAADPLAFYRGSGPLSNMVKTHPDFDYTHIPNDINWASLKRYDAIFLQRPHNPEFLKVCEIADKWDIPIIGDFDDWLYELPPSNPAALAFKQNQKTFVQIVNSLDSIMVATEKLKQLIQPLLLDQSKPIHVVPNAYDVNLFKKYRHTKNVKPKQKIFAWRGGNSHLLDMLSVKEDYRNLFQSFPDWQFVFIAQHPWILDAKNFSNVQMADPLKIIEYFRALHDTGVSILAHPLEDNEFNRAKSMCSWLEATHARAAFIGPDFEEFKRDGILNYGKDLSFFEAASRVLNDMQLMNQMYFDSEMYIMKHLTLDIVNEKRMNAFRELIR